MALLRGFPCYVCVALSLSYGLLMVSMEGAWVERAYFILDRTAWHNATARPPVVLAVVLFGWSFVVARCRSAGMKLELILGPGFLLPARDTFRSAIVLCDVILFAHLMHFVLEPVNGAADRPIYLACDVILVVLVICMVCSPPALNYADDYYDADLAFDIKKKVSAEHPSLKSQPSFCSALAAQDPMLATSPVNGAILDNLSPTTISRGSSLATAATLENNTMSEAEDAFLLLTEAANTTFIVDDLNQEQPSVPSSKKKKKMMMPAPLSSSRSGCLYPEARVGLVRAIRDSLASPFSPVTFWHVLVADYATSLAKALADVQITACVVVSFFAAGGGLVSPTRVALTRSGGASLSDAIFETYKAECSRSVANALCLALPFWCRFAQCSRSFADTGGKKHVVNALKYCSAFPLIIIGFMEKRADPLDLESLARYRKIIVVAAVVNSSFSFFWDVVVDWGLLRPKRRNVIFGSLGLNRSGVAVALGYAALLSFNLATRFAWAATVFSKTNNTLPRTMFLLEAIEVLRRTVWAIFRIEHEYISRGLPTSSKKNQDKIQRDTRSSCERACDRDDQDHQGIDLDNNSKNNQQVDTVQTLIDHRKTGFWGKR